MKSISYMMSVLLMLLIVSTVSFTAYTVTQGWFSTTLRSYTSAFEGPFTETLEEFVIEEVRLEYSGSESYVTVYLRNSGETNIRISSVYFDGRMTNIIEGSQGVTRLYLRPQESGWLKLRFDYLVSKGDLHEIVVWSDEGKKASVDWIF